MSHRRSVVALILSGIAAAGIAAAPAQAQTPDEWFTETVTKMGIPFAPNTDLPAVGHQVCDMLTTSLASNSVNPVPAVRGVIMTLTSKGMERAQAGGLLTASVEAYCPQHSRFVGR